MIPQICKVARAPSDRRRRNRRSLVAYSNDCFVQGVQHRQGSQLLAAVVDRSPPFSHFGSRKLPSFHRCLQGWRQLTPARTRRAIPVPAWEGIASQLTLLNNLHMAGIVHPQLVDDAHASVRSSGIEKEDIDPMLVPLLPCWSIVIAASETGVSTKTGTRDGSVLMDHRWLQWVNKLLPALKAGNPEDKIWNFDSPTAAKLFRLQPTLWDSAE